MSGGMGPVRLIVPARLDALASVSQALEEFLASVEGIMDAEIVTYNVVLAVHELCTNIVTHGYAGTPGDIELKWWTEQRPTRLIVSVHDMAPHTFNEGQWVAPDLNKLNEHGLGIWLIKQLMDEVDYQPAPGNNRWRLVKQI